MCHSVPIYKEWQILIENLHQKNYDKIMHYSFNSNPLFGHNKLKLIVSKLPKEYQLQTID
ncbi:GNAT family N-acetyltransferase [Gilliamella apicola]|uniref:GNAT family N-acetyltransferase n=1 Tax=Gilliamella apicola TaxID=1196095 RepID=UPI000D788848|nr:hypothetical protein DKK69_05175 [Gilliamella apicola]